MGSSGPGGVIRVAKGLSNTFRCAVQVPEHKLRRLKLPDAYELPGEQMQQLRQAAALLAAIPSLAFSNPSSSCALERSLSLQFWPGRLSLGDHPLEP